MDEKKNRLYILFPSFNSLLPNKEIIQKTSNPEGFFAQNFAWNPKNMNHKSNVTFAESNTKQKLFILP